MRENKHGRRRRRIRCEGSLTSDLCRYYASPMGYSTTTRLCCPKRYAHAFVNHHPPKLIVWQALFGLRTDLELRKGNRYSFSAAIFYLGFIVGAYPAMVLAQRFPIERVASSIVTVWGVCLILTTACHNYQALYAQRFFLGFLESGISPMFMMIVVGVPSNSTLA